MSRESIYGDEPEFTVLKMVEGKETWISLAQLAAELEAGDNGAKPPGTEGGLAPLSPASTYSSPIAISKMACCS
jgi:hypothetical protein